MPSQKLRGINCMGETSELDKKYADLFWSLANAIVGFAVAITLSFLLADASWNGAIACGIDAHRPQAVFGGLIAIMLYLGAVSYCQWASWMLTFPSRPASALSNYIWYWNLARILAVLFLAIPCALPIVTPLSPSVDCSGQPTKIVK